MSRSQLARMTVPQLLEYHLKVSREDLLAAVRGEGPSLARRRRLATFEDELRSREIEAWRDVNTEYAAMTPKRLAREVASYLRTLFGSGGTPVQEEEDITSLSVEALVARFVELAVDADNAPDMDDFAQQRDLLEAIEYELQRRDGDRRRDLLALYTHAHIAVRAAAADATRNLEPELSRGRLLSIDDPDWTPQRGSRGVVIGDTDVRAGHTMRGKRVKLGKLTVQQLVERFTAISIDEDDASWEVPRANRLVMLRWAVQDELKRRPGDQRRALVSLYDHPNMQVRLNAAKATLAVAGDAARELLQAIRSADYQPQSLDAGMTLRALEQGIYKPT